MIKALHFREPELAFANDQLAEDPRDGLSLFGPFDPRGPFGIRVGVAGTERGIGLYETWANRVSQPVLVNPPNLARPSFPGFSAAFQTEWDSEPALTVAVDEMEIQRALSIPDRFQRTFKVVSLFAEAILRAATEQEVAPDVWYVVIPDDVWLYCRPQSSRSRAQDVENPSAMNRKFALKTRTQGTLFPGDREAAVVYFHEPDFHHQLKARLLSQQLPTQIIKETTLLKGVAESDNQGERSAIAWNLASTTYYKAGGRPWKVSSARPGVCYVGIVFKADPGAPDGESACCAAQMFIDSGDGFVFRSSSRPWRSERRGEFHLTRDAAHDLLKTAISAYVRERGSLPTEIFVHGRVRFNDEEWQGFSDAAGNSTNLVGVRIREARGTKIFRQGMFPVGRGTALKTGESTALLWTRGYIPHLDTYPGREIPNPLNIEVSRGDAELELVLGDVMTLTKLNYNSCAHSDGQPVTLKFADAVGEILTAAPLASDVPLPFKYYI